MMSKTGPIDGRKYTAAYGRYMDSKGEPIRVKQSQRVVCEEYGTESTAA